MFRLCRVSRPTASLAPTGTRLICALTTARPFSTATTPSDPAELPVIKVLRLDHLRLPIASQLRIEEALLRSSAAKPHQYAVINHPPEHERTIVMGISNKTELLVHMQNAERDSVELLRRFSGGGTVLIDRNCWMGTLILNKHQQPQPQTPALVPADDNAEIKSTPALYPPSPSSSCSENLHPIVHPSSVETFPNRLMDWTRDFYLPIFNPEFTKQSMKSSPASSLSISHPLPQFTLTGSDYCFGHRKFGGNAQSITKNRWLHHTSFLWTLESLHSIAQYLTIPAKQPAYRAGRKHEEFLVSLDEVWSQVMQKQAEFNAIGAVPAAHDDGWNAGYLDHLARKKNGGRVSSDLFVSTPPPSAAPLHRAPLIIPSSLPGRFLWRLQHFYQLEYPTLGEIEQLVMDYEKSSPSGVKKIEYEEEKKRYRLMEEEQAKKAKEAASAAPSS